MFYKIRMVSIAAGALLLAASLDARTVLLGLADVDRMAVIDASAPRLSWAGQRDRNATIRNRDIHLEEGRSMLLRFAVDGLPSGQRIVHAELVIPVTGSRRSDPRFYVWRILPDWGAGVCHEYRWFRGGEGEQWVRQGARGIASDRAALPTAVISVVNPGRAVINVTEDVELWYRGDAVNNGWLVTVEDPETQVHLESPLWNPTGEWILRVTYEPAVD